MAAIKRKHTSLKVTMDGKIHYIDVTKSTTCDDVIRELLQTSGQGHVQPQMFSVYKTTGRKVKMLKGTARIIGARLLWRSVTPAEFVVKRRIPDLSDQFDNDDDSVLSEESFNQAHRFLRRIPEFGRVEDQQKKLRRMSLPVTNNLHKVYHQTTGALPAKGFLWEPTLDSLDGFFSRLEQTEMAELNRSCGEKVDKLDKVFGAASVNAKKEKKRKCQTQDSSPCKKIKLVFNKALKVKAKRKRKVGSTPTIPSVPSSVSYYKPVQPTSQNSADLPKRHTFIDGDLTGCPLHSTPTTGARSAPVIGAQLNQYGMVERKNVFKDFFRNCVLEKTPQGGERPHKSDFAVHKEKPTQQNDTSLVNAVFIQPELKITSGTAKVVKLTPTSSPELPKFESQVEKCRFFWDQDCDSDSDASSCAGDCSLDASCLDRAFVRDSQVDETIGYSEDDIDVASNTMKQQNERCYSDDLRSHCFSYFGNTSVCSDSSTLSESDLNVFDEDEELESFMSTQMCDIGLDKEPNSTEDIYTREVLV